MSKVLYKKRLSLLFLSKYDIHKNYLSIFRQIIHHTKMSLPWSCQILSQEVESNTCMFRLRRRDLFRRVQGSTVPVVWASLLWVSWPLLQTPPQVGPWSRCSLPDGWTNERKIFTLWAVINKIHRRGLAHKSIISGLETIHKRGLVHKFT